MALIPGFLLCLLLLSLVPGPAAAQGIVNTVVDGNEIRADVSLPGNVGATLTISFEQVSGLTPQSVGLSAQLVNPVEPGLTARLRDASIPLGFPVLIHVEPPAGEGLSFRGVVTITVYTHNLTFLSTLPLRIFSASPGEPFEDITESAGRGSYRARGRKGQFSDFLIATDARPVGAAITAKLSRIDQILTKYADRIDGAVLSDLSALMAAIRADVAAGRTSAAILKTGDFLDRVKLRSGSAIPDLWRSSLDRVNVAGLLRGAAETLRFSLNQKYNLGQ